jgi:N-acetylmuramoyl-L-alanine amidase
MPDDPNIPPKNPDDSTSDIPEIAPSTIFVELMRQAAAKRNPQPPPAPSPIPDAPNRKMGDTPSEAFSAKADEKMDEKISPKTDAKMEAKPREKPAKITSEIPLENRIKINPKRDDFSVIPDAPLTPEIAPAPEPPRRPRRERLQLDASEPLISHHTPAPMERVTEQPLAPSAPMPASEGVEVFTMPENDAKMEAQRIQRIKRRQEKVRRQRAGVVGGFLRTAIILFLAGGLASTIFTWFTSPDFLDRKVVSGLVIAESTLSVTLQPTILPTPNYLRKVGIVSGHRGPQNDPGAVCPDGLTEAEINFAVATQVVRNLRSLGYSVDLLDEFDERLNNYQAAALVSIHANTCRDFGEFVSGFLVAKAAVRADGGIDTLLAECIAQKYGETIGLERRFNLTVDMTDYHTFREIHPLTPASIIELGFMKDDREILTTRQDDMATAITNGVLCFLQPDPQNPNALFTTPSFFEGTATPIATP